MERIESQLLPKEYAAEMRRRVRLFPSWEGDCFSGLVIGRFFSVTYRSYFDWHRRPAYSSGHAIGYIRQIDGKSAVSYVTCREITLLLWYLIFAVIVFTALHFSFPNGDWWVCAIATILATVIFGIASFLDLVSDYDDPAFKRLATFVAEPNTFTGYEKNAGH